MNVILLVLAAATMAASTLQPKWPTRLALVLAAIGCWALAGQSGLALVIVACTSLATGAYLKNRSEEVDQ